MPLAFEEYTFDPRPRFPFLITMKRYPNLDDDQSGFTLVLAHGTGFHKEIWESIIERIFLENKKPGGLLIRDAWAIDAPNHGDAATLNMALLKTGAYDFTFSWENYSRAINLVLAGQGILTDGKNRPIKLDFASKRLIGIGHSMGAVSLILAHAFYPVVEFDSLVFVEPMLFTARHFKARGHGLKLHDLALARRDFWESKEEARSSLSAKGMKAWDKRMMELFVEFGLRKTTEEDPFDRPGVTLKCTKVQESATFKDWASQVLAFDFLESLCSSTPVHVVWGAIDDYISAPVKEDIHKNAFKGKAASIQRIANCGHLAPLVRPDDVANAILTTFGSFAAPPTTKSRL